MSTLKLFSAFLFLAVISNSAFAEDYDSLQHEITMGKIDAAELASSTDFVTKRSLALIQKARETQESIGLNSINSEGKVSALGQMITIIEDSLKEIDSLEDTRRILEMNQELEEMLK